MPSIGLNSDSASTRRVTSDSGTVQRLGQIAHPLAVLRQEFVQRRIEQPDADRQALHDLEQLR